MSEIRRGGGLIACAILSATAFTLALLALLMEFFPNMDRHLVTGHITIVDTTENPVVQIGPELSTDGTIQVRGKGGAWETVRLVPLQQP